MNNFAPYSLDQKINPWTFNPMSWFFDIGENSNNLVNINYKTENPHIEQGIVKEVAGYGMQLDMIENLLSVMLEIIPQTKLNEKQKEAIGNFHDMMQKIESQKEKLLLKQLSSSGIDKFIDNLDLLKEKYPDQYANISKKLKSAL